MTLNDKKLEVAKEFREAYEMDHDFCCVGYKQLLNPYLELDRRIIKTVVEELKIVGAVKYFRGLFTEDGEVAGSGWGVIDIEKLDSYIEKLENEL